MRNKDMEDLKDIAESLVIALEDKDEKSARSLYEDLTEKWEEADRQ